MSIRLIVGEKRAGIGYGVYSVIGNLIAFRKVRVGRCRRRRRRGGHREQRRGDGDRPEQELGLELVDASYTRRGREQTLCLYLDRPGGITVDELQAAVDRPRIHHQWMPDKLFFESDSLSPETRRARTATECG